MKKNSKNRTKGHTVGPWESIREHGGCTFLIRSKSNDNIVAQIFDMDLESVIYNAWLIRSAPDLLKVCREAVIDIDFHIAYNPMDYSLLPELRNKIYEVIKNLK